MRNKIFGRQLGRERDTRRALFRSLVRSLVEHGGIKTTKAKAKAIQPLMDKLITTAKKGTDASNRRVYALVGNDKKTSKKILEMAKKNFTKRNSGYTRIIPLGRRKGDMAEMVKLEFVDQFVSEEVKKEKKEKITKKLQKSK